MEQVGLFLHRVREERRGSKVRRRRGEELVHSDRQTSPVNVFSLSLLLHQSFLNMIDNIALRLLAVYDLGCNRATYRGVAE